MAIKPWSVRLEGTKTEILSKVDSADMPDSIKTAAKAVVGNHDHEAPIARRTHRIPKGFKPESVADLHEAALMIKAVSPDSRSEYMATKCVDAVVTHVGRFVLECSGDPDHYVPSVVSFSQNFVGAEPVVTV